MSNKNVDFNLYLITDRRLVKGDLIDVLEEALKAGVKAIQLREKDLTLIELVTLAINIRNLTNKYKARLFINDRFDVALCAKADGVHLGQSSMPADAVRKISKEKLSIGVSTHNLDEAVKAQSKGADFITLGPIFKTPSKLKYGDPIGIETIKKAKDKIKIPVFAIGGIKSHNIKDVSEAGSDGIALISGILSSKDVFDETKKYLEI